MSFSEQDMMSAKEARQHLGVSAQTLYSYVSRGHIRAFQSPKDARKSLYLREDVERWAERSARGRSRRSVAASALEWGEPALASAVTEIRDGRIYYRGQDAVSVSQDWLLEETAALLLDRDLEAPSPDRMPLLSSPDPLQRMLMALTRKVADPEVRPLDLVEAMVHAVTRRRAEGPVHGQLAEAWQLSEDEADVIRRVLVLCADHELNASAFACRVTASTGACLPACLLTGLSTLSGPRHGGMVRRSLDFMQAAVAAGGVAEVDDVPPPGFGHPLYPGGDPRAGEILRVLPLDRTWAPVVAELRDRQIHPGLDFALAHVVTVLDLPREAGLVLFAVGRAAGWMAHAEEQAKSGQLIRPRAMAQGG